MTALSKSLAGAVIGAGILDFSAVSASAGIACVGLVCWHTQSTYEYPKESRVIVLMNDHAGLFWIFVCWHTQSTYEYPKESRVIVHEDSWKWGPSEKYSFREHEGRGYWKGDSWTDWK